MHCARYAFSTERRREVISEVVKPTSGTTKSRMPSRAFPVGGGPIASSATTSAAHSSPSTSASAESAIAVCGESAESASPSVRAAPERSPPPGAVSCA